MARRSVPAPSAPCLHSETATGPPGAGLIEGPRRASRSGSGPLREHAEARCPGLVSGENLVHQLPRLPEGAPCAKGGLRRTRRSGEDNRSFDG